MKSIRFAFFVLLVSAAVIFCGTPAESVITNQPLFGQIMSYDADESSAALATPFSGLFQGGYEVMYLGFNSPDSCNIFASDADTIFRNITKNPCNLLGHMVLDTMPGEVAFVSDITSTYFSALSNMPMVNINTGRDPNGNGQGGLRLYQLLMDWTIYYPGEGDVFVPKGWVVVGFEEDASGTDWNDLVIAINLFSNLSNKIETVVPIPGAFWLLGSGLLGLIGLRHRLDQGVG